MNSSNIITVGIAEAKIIFGEDILVTYALGSCVGVCLYEVENKIAGMVHILLPKQQNAVIGSNEYKFADSGIRKLVDKMEKKGANRRRLVAKIAGGAEMFKTEETKTGIGNRNVIAVKETLQALYIPIIAEHTGNNYGRSIWFSCKDGSLKIKTVNKGILKI
ncbi:chemotaxis protein CheD [Thomasclavelia sp.]